MTTNNYPILLRRLWYHLSRHRRAQFIALFGLSMLSALTEMIGLGIVFPFLAVLISPQRILEMPIIYEFLSYFDIHTPQNLTLFFTAALIVVTLIASSLKLFLLWTSARISFMAGGDLSVEIYRRTLYQNYSTHISRNSSQVIAGIGTKVSHAMVFLHQTSILLSSFVILVGLVLTLMLIDSKVALISALSFAMAYFIISRIVKARLRRNGQVLSDQAPRSVKALQEGLGGIRDVLLDGTQKYYWTLYADADLKIRKAQAANTFINMAPRFLIEAIGITLVALLAYWLTTHQEGGETVLPILGTLAFGAQRLLPTLQAIYGAWSNILTSEASVVDALNLLDQPMPVKTTYPITVPIQFKESISFVGVNFTYAEEKNSALKNINLRIQKGERIGIIGSTGSGKSTLLDILMGLLTPTQGQLLIDQVPITDVNSLSWRLNIAHVPQSIFLADASIAENIALGVPLAEIDMSKVKRAAAQAQIADFIESKPDAYLTYVGERGVRLSGGQRQRLAIARALYKDATVLVLDEATSALDRLTEQEVMDALKGLSDELTIIMVAHREMSIKDCERIIKIENGEIFADGSFDSLLGKHY